MAKRKQSDTSKPGDNTTHTEPSSKRANAGAKATTADKVSTSSSKGKAALIKTMPASSTAQTVSKSATATATPRSDEEDYRRGHSSGSELRIVSPPGQAKKQSSKGPTKPKASTSRPKITEPHREPLPAAPPSSLEKKQVQWQQTVSEWFSQFAEEDDPNKMGGEGIEKLFEQMNVSMEGVAPFLLAWRLDAKPGTFGSYYKDDFVKSSALRVANISSSSALKGYLSTVEKDLYAEKTGSGTGDDIDFRKFYSFLFPFLKETGQKSLTGELAVAVWGIALAPKYPLAKEFVDYASSLGAGFKGVSSDMWTQLLQFCKSVGDDMTGYSEEDAWPSTIDSFAAWKRAQK